MLLGAFGANLCVSVIRSCDYLFRPFYGFPGTSIEMENKSSADCPALSGAV